MASADRPHVALVGAMGAGKSTVGRLLAELLEQPFIDNDQLLVSRAGRTARQVEAEDGLDVLHALEAALLVETLARDEPAVVAAAASTVVDPAAREALRRRAFTTWLQAPPDLLADRVAGTGRPRPGTDAAVLLDVRRRYFADVADAVVATAGLTPVESAERVLAARTASST
jgi:shikimate kinase